MLLLIATFALAQGLEYKDGLYYKKGMLYTGTHTEHFENGNVSVELSGFHFLDASGKNGAGACCDAAGGHSDYNADTVVAVFPDADFGLHLVTQSLKFC